MNGISGSRPPAPPPQTQSTSVTNGHLENAATGDKAIENGSNGGGRGGITGDMRAAGDAFELPKQGQTGVVLNPDDLFA